jgi:hypothetical protein
MGAVRRLVQLGLVTRDFGWGDGSLTIDAVGRVFQSAATLAQHDNPRFAPIARGYLDRFAREFPTTAARIEHTIRPNSQPIEGWLSLGYSEASGRVYPIRSQDSSRISRASDGPFPRSRLSEIDAQATTNIGLGPYLAGSISPEHQDGQWSIREGYLLASWKKLGVWGGRRAPAFETGAGGGLVLNGSGAFTGGGITLTDPIHLPWIFRYLGAIRYETFLSRLDSNAAIQKPWFIASHGSISPHPRLLIGVTQAFMFGGEGVAPFTWRNFVAMFMSHGVNILNKEYENGIASGEIRFRPPIPVVPLSLYMEWGAEDNHRAWVLFPARVIGAQVPSIPGIPALSLGIEHTGFAKPCTVCGTCDCGYYATWYRHYLFQDGWTLDREPLGHPLGGQGYEWLVYGSWDDPAKALRLDARSFLRDREQYNIYSPTRRGKSVGGSLSAVYRATPKLDFLLSGAFEDGHSGWQESSVFSGFRWTF